MDLHSIKNKLEEGSSKKVVLKINNNRSTMVSVRWDPQCTKVSLHEMFCEAPGNIMDDLACYVRQEQESISSNVRAFIEDRLQTLDYSHQLDLSKLYSKGNVYDLQKIYDKMNYDYFQSRIKLNITWFGRPSIKAKSQITFGLYHDPLKLIKVHRLLDSPSFPDYVVNYVVYHEMLHHVCPSYYDMKGIHRIHSREFKEKEKEFEHFNLAQEWIKEHIEFLFHTI